MKKYEVLLSATAIDDIDQIYSHIFYTYYSPEYGKRFFDRIMKAIHSLQIMPYRNEKIKYGRYKMRVNSYLIIYTISKEESVVYIMDVIHQKRLH